MSKYVRKVTTPALSPLIPCEETEGKYSAPLLELERKNYPKAIEYLQNAVESWWISLIFLCPLLTTKRILLKMLPYETLDLL